MEQRKLRLRGEALAWREVGEETIALDLDASLYLAANSSGTLLWNELAAGTTRDALVSRLVQVYGVEPDVAATDVDEFLAALEANGLLETEGESAASS
jgi:hypothetical protein